MISTTMEVLCCVSSGVLMWNVLFHVNTCVITVKLLLSKLKFSAICLNYFEK
jgi:hypothetical protein